MSVKLLCIDKAGSETLYEECSFFCLEYIYIYIYIIYIYIYIYAWMLLMVTKYA